jgi:hypothetical protein
MIFMNGVNESDWKLFRKKLPGWQEAYMEKLTQEYAAILAGPGLASEKFWKLEKRINSDKRCTGVIGFSRRGYDGNPSWRCCSGQRVGLACVGGSRRQTGLHSDH